MRAAPNAISAAQTGCYHTIPSSIKLYRHGLNVQRFVASACGLPLCRRFWSEVNAHEFTGGEGLNAINCRHRLHHSSWSSDGAARAHRSKKQHQAYKQALQATTQQCIAHTTTSSLAAPYPAQASAFSAHCYSACSTSSLCAALACSCCWSSQHTQRYTQTMTAR